jgi:serine/threonine protein kinase
MSVDGVTSESGKVRAKFLPFGLPNENVEFKTDAEAKQAMLHVVSAVTALHQAGLVHNDIRWANVVRSTSGDWFLVDYDLMAQLDESKSVPAIAFLTGDSHSEHICKPHGLEVDIWGLGHLMETCRLPDQSRADFVKWGALIKVEAHLDSDFNFQPLQDFLST